MVEVDHKTNPQLYLVEDFKHFAAKIKKITKNNNNTKKTTTTNEF